MTLVVLALAGGVGAVTRFVVDTAVARRHRFRIPLGTLLINVSGSLLLGILTGWVSASHGASTASQVRAVVGTGFCGGYTTFSTASLETIRLWVAEGAARGGGYALLTLAGCVAAAATGMWLGSLA